MKKRLSGLGIGVILSTFKCAVSIFPLLNDRRHKKLLFVRLAWYCFKVSCGIASKFVFYSGGPYVCDAIARCRYKTRSELNQQLEDVQSRKRGAQEVVKQYGQNLINLHESTFSQTRSQSLSTRHLCTHLRHISVTRTPDAVWLESNDLV